MYLVSKIIAACENSSQDWRRGASGGRTMKIEQSDYNKCGKTALVEEAIELEQKGLISIDKWVTRGSDVQKISFRVENLPRFYELAIQEAAEKEPNVIWPKQEKVDYYLQFIKKELEKGFHNDWIKSYYQWLLDKISEGKFTPEVEKYLLKIDKYIPCYRGIDELTQPMFKRLFSKKYLKNSKLFEKELESHVIATARHYCKELDDNMDKTTVLSQMFIEEYSQSLEIKGPLQVKFLAGNTADNLAKRSADNQADNSEKALNLGEFLYGVTLNSAMLQNCEPVENQTIIHKIITIENKANFVMAPYDPHTLYIFSHGYFSPKEVQFLQQLKGCLQESNIEYYHSGDLDYGGICIFQFIQKNIFPELKPYMMNAEVFEQYLNYGEKAKSSTLEKVKSLDVPELQSIIKKILETGLTIEQECFLIE